MAQEQSDRQRPRFWMIVIALVIFLIFLYFYAPFETFLVASIPNVHFSNVIFWFVSLVGLVAYAIAHWQSFKRNIVRSVSELEVDGLVFETLQISILVAVIFCAGATIQAIELVSQHLITHGTIFGGGAGAKLLSIVLLVLLAIAFYLLHHAVRGFRQGWRPKRPPRVSSND